MRNSDLADQLTKYITNCICLSLQFDESVEVVDISQLCIFLSAFDQVSEFDRGKIVTYRDCGLPFRKIGSRVGRNQTIVMQIYDHWMQEGTTDQRGRSHPPQ
ncbi:transposable element Tcb1 transposase [Trichonephila clavipes]|nr:transposable element Tcb1 transposase [Trichonephila clavipes]